jgi:hypothetical protein
MKQVSVLLTAVLLALGPAQARQLDLTKPEDVIAAEIKLGCAADPQKPRMSWMSGKIIGRRQGEADRHLVDVQGVNTRACQIVSDPKRGPGYRSVTREIMFYLDPTTGKILETWINPYTGETVDVIHMFNDPVNMPEPKHAYGKDGKPVTWPGRIVNGLAVTSNANSFFRDGPMSGDFQDYVGGKYAVVEVSTMMIPAADWLNTETPGPVRGASAWTRVSPWLPWMKMAGREGQTVLAATWFTAATLDEAPEPLKSEVRAKYPIFATAPPLDDTRPSVTSWLAAKKAIDQRRSAAKK